ncbi:hypothetical protein [Sphingomonas sp. Leaf412]|uniref:hypothetical protein n=1 Tax=Sphingomonas sp. Leaf412 TaxID=1736370 RepID=UPI0012E3B9FA|nr:hypothetical protein [Sphingomonas sp. Leaf412]
MADIYVRAGRYVARCPWLFLAVVAAEMVQHAIEYRAGFYDGIAAMKAAEGDVLRMAMGHVKVLLLFATTYWALRFLAAGDDPAAPTRRDPRAMALYVPVMLWGVFWLLVVQDGPILARAMNVPARPLGIGLLVVILASTAFEVTLSAWKVSAATGDGGVGFRRSIRMTRGHYAWSLGMTIAAMLPAMVLHYALAFAALGRGPMATWTVLLGDSLLVGYMAPVMAAAVFAVAQRVGGEARSADAHLTRAGART